MAPPSTGSSAGAGPSLNYSYSQQSQPEWMVDWSPTDPSNGMFAGMPQEGDYGVFNSQGSVNPNLIAYANPFGAMLGLPGQGESPPSSSFAAPGLPFPGLDYIRNYNTGTYEENNDALWQAFDGGEFRFDPDLPFSLGDLNHEGNHQ